MRYWEAGRYAAAVAARPSVETAAEALWPPGLFKFGSQLAARGGGQGGFYFLSLRADSPAAQPWPRDGSRLVGWFVCEGFFPSLAAGLHCVPAALGGGRTVCHGGRRGRAGGDGRTDGRTDGGVAVLLGAARSPRWKKAAIAGRKWSSPHAFFRSCNLKEGSRGGCESAVCSEARGKDGGGTAPRPVGALLPACTRGVLLAPLLGGGSHPPGLLCGEEVLPARSSRSPFTAAPFAALAVTARARWSGSARKDSAGAARFRAAADSSLSSQHST